MITETGQNVQLFAEEEIRLEPGLVQTQLRDTEELIVLGRIHKLATVTLIRVMVGVNLHSCFFLPFQPSLLRISTPTQNSKLKTVNSTVHVDKSQQYLTHNFFQVTNSSSSKSRFRDCGRGWKDDRRGRGRFTSLRRRYSL